MPETIPQPTAAELEILQLLWELGPCTVKQINGRMNQAREVGYTTTLKMMQIMTEKGLLTRSLNGRSHIYAAMEKPAETRSRLLDNLLHTAFGGSVKTMVMQVLGHRDVSKEELEEIGELIQRMEEKRDDGAALGE